MCLSVRATRMVQILNCVMFLRRANRHFSGLDRFLDCLLPEIGRQVLAQQGICKSIKPMVSGKIAKTLKLTQRSVVWVRHTASFKTARKTKKPVQRRVKTIQPSVLSGSMSPISICR